MLHTNLFSHISSYATKIAGSPKHIVLLLLFQEIFLKIVSSKTGFKIQIVAKNCSMNLKIGRSNKKKKKKMLKKAMNSLSPKQLLPRCQSIERRQMWRKKTYLYST
jgi:hypothetical protein